MKHNCGKCFRLGYCARNPDNQEDCFIPHDANDETAYDFPTPLPEEPTAEMRRYELVSDAEITPTIAQKKEYE